MLVVRADYGFRSAGLELKRASGLTLRLRCWMEAEIETVSLG